MIHSFMKFKDLINECSKDAKKSGDVCVYIEDVLVKFFETNKIPDYLKGYRVKINKYVKFLKQVHKDRVKNQVENTDYSDFTEVDGVFFQPTLYDFFEIFSGIDMSLSMFTMKSDEERTYSLVILTIMFSQDLMLKAGCDDAGLDDEIIDNIREYMTKSTMESNNQLLKTLNKIMGKQNNAPNEEGAMLMPQIRIISNNRGEQDEDYSYLEEYCTNLTEEIGKVEWTKLVGRETEIQELQEILLRRDKPNAILVGEPGVGKTKLVQGFTKLIKQKKCNEFFNGYEVYQLNIMDLTAGTSLHGQFEERMSGIINELQQKEKVILYIDEIHQIRNDSERVADIASMLKPLLTDGKIKIIGSTTEEEYRTSFGKDSALERRFKMLKVKEPTFEETIKILKGIKSVYEKYHNVKYDSKIIDLIAKLAEKYILDKRFPDKAIDLLDSIGAYCKQQNKQTDYKVSSDDVYTIVAKLANLPKIQLEENEIDKLAKLDEILKEKIIGQDTAIKDLVNGVMIAKSGLRERNKTALTLFFKGPSGVGKTESIKQLAEALSIPLYRYDMSEYMEEHTISKLIGTPPGYVGYENGRAGSGLLINQVKSTPYCIVLLDEIEKANPKVLNVFLQIMDNGKLTSSSGVEADFSNVFLFMTSNVGASESHKMASIGFGADNNKSASDEFFNSSFSPEFRNRLDGAVSFNNLTDEVMNKITDNELIGLRKVLADKKVKLGYDTSVVNYISGKASKENLGARPIKRIIHNEIKNVISKELVCGKLFKGGKLNITVNEDKLKFKY